MREEGDTVVFDKDHLFNSPSMAADRPYGEIGEWLAGVEIQGRQNAGRPEASSATCIII